LPRSPATRSSPACGTKGPGAATAEQNGIEHIAEAQWADALVVAPATANILAKFAHGIADDFLTTMYLATHCAGAGGAGHEREHVGASGHAGEP
jgi:phosphopantothenoylcysteine synthetase/decarboxylase